MVILGRFGEGKASEGEGGFVKERVCGGMLSDKGKGGTQRRRLFEVKDV